jgi:hypothetical protein
MRPSAVISIFAEAEDLAEKRATYPNSDVFQIDRNLLDMFKQNVEYKNAFMHLIIAESRAYFKNGLVIPESYKKATNDLCDENDKMKQFIENQFEIAGAFPSSFGVETGKPVGIEL